MSWQAIVMWAAALVVGVPSAWRNATAGALVLCWLTHEINKTNWSEYARSV